MYVELHSSSAFSFLRAATLPEPLVDRAAMLGYPAVALLDRDGVYGAPRFHKAATAAGLKPLIGAELTLAGNWEQGTGNRETRAARQRDNEFYPRSLLPVPCSLFLSLSPPKRATATSAG